MFKKIMITLMLTISTFAVTCSSSDGYKVSIDKEDNAQLVTPSDTYYIEKVRGAGTQYFGKVEDSEVKSFSLNILSGDFKLWTSSNVITRTMDCK